MNQAALMGIVQGLSGLLQIAQHLLWRQDHGSAGGLSGQNTLRLLRGRIGRENQRSNLLGLLLARRAVSVLWLRLYIFRRVLLDRL
jgi:hypothetical protein